MMRDTLQDALDNLISSRSSRNKQGRALATLEYLIAVASINLNSRNLSDEFFALQDSFECNVPSRLLTWISSSAATLGRLTDRTSTNLPDRQAETIQLSAQLCQALFILQGVALNHNASKRYMGRRCALEVLLDLLAVSRHLNSPDGDERPTAQAPSRNEQQSASLTSVVIDTLLCILVDSPCALRTFEVTNGVHTVVRLLKRAGSPREVRIKCLEFLFFYLLDEAGSSAEQNPSASVQNPFPSPHSLDPPPTAPSSPSGDKTRALGTRHLPTRNQSEAPLNATRCHTSGSSSSSSSSLYSSPSSSFWSSSSFCSKTSSISSVSSHSPLRQYAHAKEEHEKGGRQLHSRALSLLPQEVHFVPLSPGKPAPSSLPSSSSSLSLKQETLHSRSQRQQLRLEQVDSFSFSDAESTSSSGWDTDNKENRESLTPTTARPGHLPLRTTEQKKTLLGELLGNVDALMEGVSRAGIWGLA